MTRVIISALVLAIFAAACGPKTTSKVAVDPQQAQAKFGEYCNKQETLKLAEAEAIKLEADAIQTKAEEHFNDAKELMKKAEAEEAKEKIQWYKQRAEKAFEKGYAKKAEASEKYKVANAQSLAAYKSASQRFKTNAPDYIKDAAKETENKVEALSRGATQLRKQADSEKDPKKKSQLLAQADEKEFLAIDAQRKVMDFYSGKINVPMPESEVQEEDKVNTVITPKKDEPEAMENKANVSEKIVYKIQIAASRLELESEKLLAIYSPKPGEIINNTMEDGWYKYAIGKFETYAEAQAYKEAVEVPGAFIIAYKENEKIILPEIQEKIRNGEIPQPQPQKNIAPIAQSDVIYMVQIAATQIPARPSQVQQMYHGKQIVSIRQSRGWYKYTVGNFDTREKAEKFREEAGVKDSFVVAFDKTGKEVLLER